MLIAFLLILLGCTVNGLPNEQPSRRRTKQLDLQDIQASIAEDPTTFAPLGGNNAVNNGYLPPAAPSSSVPSISGAQSQQTFEFKSANSVGDEPCKPPFGQVSCTAKDSDSEIPKPSRDLTPPFNDLEQDKTLLANATPKQQVKIKTEAQPKFITTTEKLKVKSFEAPVRTTPKSFQSKPTTAATKAPPSKAEATNELTSYLPPQSEYSAAAQTNVAVVQSAQQNADQDHHHDHHHGHHHGENFNICDDAFHSFLCAPLKARKRITGAFPSNLRGSSSFINYQKFLPNFEREPASSNTYQNEYLPPKRVPSPTNQIQSTRLPSPTTKRPVVITTTTAATRPAPKVIPQPSNSNANLYLPPLANNKIAPAPSNTPAPVFSPPKPPSTPKPVVITTTRTTTAATFTNPTFSQTPFKFNTGSSLSGVFNSLSSNENKFYLPPSANPNPQPSASFISGSVKPSPQPPVFGSQNTNLVTTFNSLPSSSSQSPFISTSGSIIPSASPQPAVFSPLPSSSPQSSSFISSSGSISPTAFPTLSPQPAVFGSLSPTLVTTFGPLPSSSPQSSSFITSSGSIIPSASPQPAVFSPLLSSSPPSSSSFTSTSGSIKPSAFSSVSPQPAVFGSQNTNLVATFNSLPTNLPQSSFTSTSGSIKPSPQPAFGYQNPARVTTFNPLPSNSPQSSASFISSSGSINPTALPAISPQPVVFKSQSSTQVTTGPSLSNSIFITQKPKPQTAFSVSSTTAKPFAVQQETQRATAFAFGTTSPPFAQPSTRAPQTPTSGYFASQSTKTSASSVKPFPGFKFTEQSSNQDKSYLPPDLKVPAAAQISSEAVAAPQNTNPFHHGRDLCTDPFHSFLCVNAKPRKRITGQLPAGFSPDSSNTNENRLSPESSNQDENKIRPDKPLESAPAQNLGYVYPKPSNPLPTFSNIIPSTTASPSTGYSYPKPDKIFPLPSQQNALFTASTTSTTPKPELRPSEAKVVTGYQYPKPENIFPSPAVQTPVTQTTNPPTTGYSYPKPQKPFPSPTQQKELRLKPKQKSPPPQVDLPSATNQVKGYQYPKPEQSLKLPEKSNGYSYPKPTKRLELPTESRSKTLRPNPAVDPLGPSGSADFIPVNKLNFKRSESKLVAGLRRFGERQKKRLRDAQIAKKLGER